jgi:hypothetical protein
VLALWPGDPSVSQRFWTCRRCKARLPRLKQKCACGQARPVRKTAAQKALEDPYEVWEERFGAECGICGRVASDRRRLDRDHCHKTGAARGLLCALQSVACRRG